MSGIIALDVDGVLFRWGRSARRVLLKKFGLEVSENEWFGRHHCTEEQWEWIWGDEGTAAIYGEGEAFPGAIDAARELFKLGHLRIMTAVPPNAREPRRSWLAKVGIPYDELVLLEPTDDGVSAVFKSAVLPHADVYIDDNPNNCVELAQNTDALILLVDHSWNRGEEWDRKVGQYSRIVRTFSWEEVLELTSDKLNETEEEEIITGTTVTDEATKLVYGDRQRDYGHPRTNMKAAAGLMQSYLEARFPGGVIGEIELQPEDAAIMMIQLKIARFAAGRKTRDTVRDIAGYAGVVARVIGLDE